MADRKILRLLRIYLCHYIILLTLGTSDAACTFPSQFQSSTYEDSYKGTLTFTTNTMTGWPVVAYGNNVTHWQCHIDTSFSPSSGGLLVFKATDSIIALGASFYGYLCLNITKITDNSFYYYQMNGIQPNAENERVLVTNDNTLSTVDTTCSISYGGHEAEFKVLLKSGMASAAAQNVTTELFADFDYTYTHPNGTTTCANSSDNWVFCNTRVSMTFNFTTCSQPIAYGTSGIWYHIVTVSLSYKYMVVFNSAASSKFTCFAFSDNTKTTFVNDYCRSGQTNTTLPTVGGVTIGAKLTMTAYNTCYNSSYKSASTTKGQTTRPVNNPNTTTKTVPSSPPKVTQTTPPTAQQSSSADPPVGSIKSPDRQENPDTATLSAEGGISTGAVVAIGVTIGILAAVALTVVIIYLLIKRRSPRIKRKVLSFMNFSK